MEAHRPVIVYISAASDLMAEREALARMIAGLPVTLAWRIVQSPLGVERLDLEILAAADFYLLLLGGDIRAPVGQEWFTAHRAGRPFFAFLKGNVPRTPAGQAFARETDVTWRPFLSAADLVRQVQRLLAGQLLSQAVRYALTPPEIEALAALQAGEGQPEEPAGREETGRSAVILSRERFRPSDGVIIDET